MFSPKRSFSGIFIGRKDGDINGIDYLILSVGPLLITVNNPMIKFNKKKSYLQLFVWWGKWGSRRKGFLIQVVKPHFVRFRSL